MKFTEEELMWHIKSQALIFMPARVIVEKAWEEKEKFHESGQFIYIEGGCPWKEHLLDIEYELEKVGLIKFVFFKDTRKMYRVQAIPEKSTSFTNRISLHQDWRGLRDKELKEKSGIHDIEFVHNSGFIGGAWSQESVIKMGLLSVEEHYK